MLTAVTGPDVVLELRSPPSARAIHGIALVAAIVLVVLALSADLPVWFAAALLALAVCGGAAAVASTLSHVCARADGWLEVRNRLSTRQLQRNDIDRVFLAWTGSNRRLVLLLRDGATLPLAATEVPPLPGRRRWLEEQAAEVRNWLRDDRSFRG